MTRGVYLNRQTGKWRASLNGVGRRGYIGEFESEALAVDARRAAEIALHGAEHARCTIRHGEAGAFVPLIGRDGQVRAWAAIDWFNIPLAEGHRWALSRSGYAVSRIDGTYTYLHRLVLPGEGVADHIDGDKLNCRRANLRLCTQRDNSRNRRGSKRSRSGVKGVSITDSGRYAARIMVDRKPIGLGVFDTLEDAAAAYNAAAAKHFGEFAKPVRIEALSPQPTTDTGAAV